MPIRQGALLRLAPMRLHLPLQHSPAAQPVIAEGGALPATFSEFGWGASQSTQAWRSSGRGLGTDASMPTSLTRRHAPGSSRSPST
jgi:hypothetical protein